MSAGQKIGVTICEDIWTEHYLPRPLYDCEPVRSLVEQGAEIIVNLSASPFSLHKPAIRYEMVGALARAYQRPIFYCNAVGGNDQLVFDGNSIAVNAAGESDRATARLSRRRASRRYGFDRRRCEFREAARPEELFDALSLGLRDYLRKCGFQIRRARTQRRHRFRGRRRHRRRCARPGERDSAFPCPASIRRGAASMMRARWRAISELSFLRNPDRRALSRLQSAVQGNL